MCLSLKWREVFFFFTRASVHEKIDQHQHEGGNAQYPGEEIFTHVCSLKNEVNASTGRDASVHPADLFAIVPAIGRRNPHRHPMFPS